ncbi:hypothetical protein [Mangrovihabitans endophyticus]|uniref:Uncharacterized protein n=1 Tax=Mangrovihabitans endophyticus TaxID=1751298 RepID=A0A8J3BXC8_9ACTN|nr:hypothetical protein [Mangrovihabitans endophyticus]GGK79134.1 hypothetical protein GCM10012284_11430 [Mangrovihabitans endophyticus]
MTWAIHVQTREGQPITSPSFDDREEAEEDLACLRGWLEDENDHDLGWLAVPRNIVISASLVEEA